MTKWYDTTYMVDGVEVKHFDLTLSQSYRVFLRQRMIPNRTNLNYELNKTVEKVNISHYFWFLKNIGYKEFCLPKDLTKKEHEAFLAAKKTWWFEEPRRVRKAKKNNETELEEKDIVVGKEVVIYDETFVGNTE